MNKRKFNDYELLYMMYQMDELAFYYLAEQYHAEIIKTLVSYMRLNYRYLDIDDFYQRALLKLYETVYDFKPNGCSFHFFYMNALRNELVDQIRRLNKPNEVMARMAISLNAQIEDRKGTYCLADMVIQETYPETELGLTIRRDMIYVQAYLNPDEKEVLRLRGLGYTYEQVANTLHITKKRVEYILRKIRKRKKTRDSD